MKIKCIHFIAFAITMSSSAFAQTNTVPKGWHLMDNATDGFNGVSANKAYDFLKSKKLKSKTVIVAVIDSGIDTAHEDLKSILWTNPGEIPNNGKDDDNNGYVDDIHGWNFIGGKDGRNVKEDSYEAARVYHKLKAKWDGVDPKTVKLPQDQLAELNMFIKAKKAVVGDVDVSQGMYMKKTFQAFVQGDSIIRKDIGKQEYNCEDLKNYKPTQKLAMQTQQMLLGICSSNNSNDITNQQIIDEFSGEIRKIDDVTKAPEEYRKNIVKDDETNLNDRKYGNNDLMASTPFHGTHCSGIIAAIRNNGKGIDGIADNVRIMMLRAVPDGDEHDKDIANAIRYAVDNGAQIISMSFGKNFSPQKQWVDDAFRYAAQKNVLLVHAAANDAKDIDKEENFPSTTFIDGKGMADNVITVGASGDDKAGGLTAAFSNYGKAGVDVFAPGVQIYSCIPGGNTYGNAQGTSMACPLVAGEAALILEYFPTLSAKQLKYVIENSVVKPAYKVNKPGTKDKVDLSEICKTGGIINAYEAVKLASTIKGDLKASNLTPSKTNNKGKKK